MKRIITIYLAVAGTISALSSIFQTQPALFIINFFAPHEGDRYPLVGVFVITLLVLIIPLFIYVILAWLMRKKGDANIAPGRTGIFVTRIKSFQSALIGIPILINDKKAGVIDNGKTKFFDTPAGLITVQAVYGKQVSEKEQVTVSEGAQLKFILEIVHEGLHHKYVLKQV